MAQGWLPMIYQAPAFHWSNVQFDRSWQAWKVCLSPGHKRGCFRAWA